MNDKNTFPLKKLDVLYHILYIQTKFQSKGKEYLHTKKTSLCNSNRVNHNLRNLMSFTDKLTDKVNKMLEADWYRESSQKYQKIPFNKTDEHFELLSSPTTQRKND